MSVIPWEEGILVPASDLTLPVWLGGVADMVGFTFPNVSEKTILSLGKDYARLARSFEQTREGIDNKAVGLTVNNTGEALAAFSMFRERLSGTNASHMTVSVAAAGLIAALYCGAGVQVVAMKLKAIAALADAFLQTEAVRAIAAAVPETAPAIAALSAVTHTLVTVLTTIVEHGRRNIALLFDAAGRIVGLYTRVATPVLQHRPPDEARGNVPYVAVPGGLGAHEGVGPSGGHTLSKHVNVDDAYITRRVARGEAGRASRWLDRRTAERVTARVIGLNRATIAAWLASSGNPRMALRLGSTQDGVTGWSVDASHAVPQQVTGARVVLQKDPTQPGGYFILTSYPEP